MPSFCVDFLLLSVRGSVGVFCSTTPQDGVVSTILVVVFPSCVTLWILNFLVCCLSAVDSGIAVDYLRDVFFLFFFNESIENVACQYLAHPLLAAGYLY